MFSCEFYEIFKNTFFHRSPPVAASGCDHTIRTQTCDPVKHLWRIFTKIVSGSQPLTILLKNFNIVDWHGPSYVSETIVKKFHKLLVFKFFPKLIFLRVANFIQKIYCSFQAKDIRS